MEVTGSPPEMNVSSKSLARPRGRMFPLWTRVSQVLSGLLITILPWIARTTPFTRSKSPYPAPPENQSTSCRMTYRSLRAAAVGRSLLHKATTFHLRANWRSSVTRGDASWSHSDIGWTHGTSCTASSIFSAAPIPHTSSSS